MMKRWLLLWMLAGLVGSASAQDKYPGFETNPNGLRYKLHQHSDGPHPRIGQILLVDIIAVASNDSVIFNSYYTGIPFQIPMTAPTFKGGLEEGLALLTYEDSATFIVPADSLYGKTFRTNPPDFVLPGTDIVMHIKVKDFLNQKDLESKQSRDAELQRDAEKRNIDTYVKTNQLDMRFTASGLGFQVLNKTNKRQVKQLEKVAITYTGKFLDGRIFQTTEGSENAYVFVVGVGTVVPGFDEAVSLMREGEKFRFIVPFDLAYGPLGNGFIPAYSTLIFEIELLSILK